MTSPRSIPRAPHLAIALLAIAVGACGSAIPSAMHLAAPLGPLGGEVRVLAPPAGAGSDAIPVVYFLHDFWGSDAVLWEHGVAQRLAAREASGDLPPFLLVAPEGDRGFWTDSWDGARRYESWLHNELPAWVASRWHVRTGRAARAWVGISMGGLGAVKAGLRQPGATGAIVSISGLLVPLDPSFVRDARLFLRRPLTRVFGPTPDEIALRDSDPYRLLATLVTRGTWVPSTPDTRCPSNVNASSSSSSKYCVCAKSVSRPLPVTSSGHRSR